MDQKTYPNLNPKMKETYDRIMGTTAGSHTQSPAPSPTHAAGPAPAKETPVPAYHASSGHLSHLAYNAASGTKQEKGKDQQKSPAKSAPTDGKKNSLLLPIALVAGGIIFFIGYGFFWMTFFGMN